VKADPAGSRRHTAFAQLPGWVFVPNIPGLSGNIDRMINPSGLQAQYAPHKVRDNYAEANGPRSGTACAFRGIGIAGTPASGAIPPALGPIRRVRKGLT
jgi:hypothetical protein